MKRTLGLAAAMMLAVFVAQGCGGDSHESLAEEHVDLMEEMSTILEGVKDEASAKAAKTKLEALGKKMEALQQRQAKLPQPTEAEMKAMDASTKLNKRMEDAAMKFQGQVMRVMMDPKTGPTMQGLDQTMPKTMR